MAIIRITWPELDRLDVTPVLSPTVPNADMLSKNRSMKGRPLSEKASINARKNTGIIVNFSRGWQDRVPVFRIVLDARLPLCGVL